MKTIDDFLNEESIRMFFEEHVKTNLPGIRANRWGESYRSTQVDLLYRTFRVGLTVGVRIGSGEVEVPEQCKPTTPDPEVSALLSALPSEGGKE